MKTSSSVFIVLFLLCSGAVHGQLAGNNEGAINAKRVAERELKIQQLKIIFNRFGQDYHLSQLIEGELELDR